MGGYLYFHIYWLVYGSEQLVRNCSSKRLSLWLKFYPQCYLRTMKCYKKVQLKVILSTLEPRMKQKFRANDVNYSRHKDIEKKSVAMFRKLN